jgi:hypothetical protein
MLKPLLVLSLVLLGLAAAPGAARARETDIVVSTVSQDGMVGLLLRPAVSADRVPAGAVPAVLVLGGSEGGLSPEVTQEARLIAQHGMAAFQLAYFGTGDLPESLQLIPLEYFMHAIAWLGVQPGIDPARIAILGTSVGGEAALLIASHDNAVHAVVAAVPSGIVWQGLGIWGQRNPLSSFSWHGQALPSLPHGVARGTTIFDRYASGLSNLGRHRDAIMPVERIRGPVMLVCGGRDVIWPSCPMARMVAAQLHAAHFVYPVAVLAFPKAGHAVFGPPRAVSDPTYPDLGSLGGTPAANDAARTEDWPAFLAFLDRAFDDVADESRIGLASK